jgi:hypothetical protein
VTVIDVLAVVGTETMVVVVAAAVRVVQKTIIIEQDSLEVRR